ncbi:MAG: DNA-3-methyladenine glycosylase 2 family protein, partial [Nocardioides sp.]
RAVLGQQVSVAGARTLAARLATELGEPVCTPWPELTRTFPGPAALAQVAPESLAMPQARGRALQGLCAALSDDSISLDRGSARHDVRRQLLALPGIGPWTADYIVMRALGDPDVFLSTDLGVRHALAARGAAATPAEATRLAARWAPWRSYAVVYLWRSVAAGSEN